MRISDWSSDVCSSDLQVTAIYRPRLFIVEAGNSFGLFSDFAKRLGLTVNRVKLSPGSGISLAPFADARRLIQAPSDVQTPDADPLGDDLDRKSGVEGKSVVGSVEMGGPRIIKTKKQEK